jgi:RimJ/RimL family protein N-acetyltransferase
MTDQLTVRELTVPDIEHLVNYWMNAGDDYLIAMGVDLSKMPKKEQLTEMLQQQVSADYRDKNSYALIWLVNGVASGHSNINKIIFGEEAFMHLHLWNGHLRKKGYGTAFIGKSLPYFFKNFSLKKLFSEPYALNPAPHHALQKSGFDSRGRYITVPGSINFRQEVMLWEMSLEKFSELYGGSV